MLNGSPASPSVASPRRRVIANLWGPRLDLAGLAWEPFREGVQICPLYGDRSDGAAAALLKYERGARVPHHQHSDWEHILVLQGSQRDEAAEYDAGSLVLNAPGSEHAVASPDGCVVLAIWTGPVKGITP